MKFNRQPSQHRRTALIAATLALATGSLHAQDSYPARPITMIVPLSAGSQMDILGRAIAETMNKQAQQPVVVLNRDGAALAVGMDALAKAKPDGYTIGFGPDGTLSLSPHLYPNLPLKPTDFELVCRTNITSLMVVVGPQSPFKTLDDLIAAARQQPGKLSYGTPGTGTAMHLLMEALGIKLNHVPFRNISDMTLQTLSGVLDFTVTVPNTLAANSARGMRGLAMTGDAVIPGLPAVPLVRDLVDKNSPVSTYGIGNVGVYTPKGVPPQALEWLRTACKAATESASFINASSRTFTLIRYTDSMDFLRAMQNSSQLSADFVRKLNITLQGQ